MMKSQTEKIANPNRRSCENSIIGQTRHQRFAKRIDNRFGTQWGARQSERGQIVVEYVLLLTIAIVLAALITRTMVSRDANSPGFVLKAWQEMVNEIGADKADDIKR